MPKNRNKWSLRKILIRVFFIILPFVILLFIRSSFILLQWKELPKYLVFIISIITGVFAIMALFFSLDRMVSQFPRTVSEKIRPYIFILPAVAILILYLLYPMIRTVLISFMDSKGKVFNGLKNYIYIFTDSHMLVSLRNSALWIVFVTFFTVALGLVIAVLVDKIRWEKLAKSLIFLPMAISFVGASVIWRFIYYYKPPGEVQIGLLNAIVTSFGGKPQGWLLLKPWNNFFLMIIMVWLLTGYAMVIISASVKGVPKYLVEAARIDGANEFTIFFRITIPYISKTILTVATTILIMVLKVFDIVFVMTNGQFDTSVIAHRFYLESFVYRNFGRGSALAVILLIAVIPFMIWNIRKLYESGGSNG
jgi:alpha-glucoside transport system permease protein